MKKIYVFLPIILLAAACSKQANLANNQPSPTPVQQICKEEPEGTPAIYSLNPNSAPVGSIIEIHGCNLSGFEGDKNAWIVNNQGVKGILYGLRGSNSEHLSTNTLLKVRLDQKLCQEDISYKGDSCTNYLNLTPGHYKIYATPWATKTNEVDFTVSSGQVYENQYLKVNLVEGWTAKEAVKIQYNVNNQKQTLPNPAAVNITKGNYILYINVAASQASGVEGGRFAEIAMGAPSADAVVTEQPSECFSKSDAEISVTSGHPREDLYISQTDVQNFNMPFCKAPSDGSTAWYFSYIADATKGGKGYFNYYGFNEGTPIGYVITMSYNSKDVNKLPKKGNPELNQMLNEMTEMVRSLKVKQ